MASYYSERKTAQQLKATGSRQLLVLSLVCLGDYAIGFGINNSFILYPP